MMFSAESIVSVLFAEVLLFWHAANYLFSADPTRNSHRHNLLSRPTILRLGWFCVRALAAAGATMAVAGSPGVRLAGVVFAGCVLLPVARWLWVPTRYLAEFEVAANAGFVFAAQWLIVRDGLHIQRHLMQMPERTFAAYAIAAALLIFVVRGGTLIVRGVLDRAGTMPPVELTQAPPGAEGSPLELQRALPVDTIELNHGRLIGNVERLILVLFVANGQYTALAFFFAAKGLIRSKDVERRAWADYLILGSLTSFLVAVVAGLLIQAVFRLAER